MGAVMSFSKVKLTVQFEFKGQLEVLSYSVVTSTIPALIVMSTTPNIMKMIPKFNDMCIGTL